MTKEPASLHSLLSDFWLETLAGYEQIYIGFSGGLDSTVLLHVLANEPLLSHKLQAVHINHGLSEYAAAWQQHCFRICQENHIVCHTQAVSCHSQANIEEEARKARYQVFAQLVRENQCLLTAHHQDDQAETALLHLFRGAGVKGLAAMNAAVPLGHGYLHRPFLTIARQTLVDYAQKHQLVWIEDDSNNNTRFSRNFIRQQVLPLLETKWPAVKANLTRTSYLCRQAQDNLDDLALIDHPDLIEKKPTLSLVKLVQLNQARLINVLRYWLQKQITRLPSAEIMKRLVTEVIHAEVDSNPKLTWDDVIVIRFRDQLYLYQNDFFSSLSTLPKTPIQWSSFPEPMLLVGLGTLVTQTVTKGLAIQTGDHIEVRFREGGEVLFWRGQHKSLKKLMQDWGVAPWLRSSIPLIYSHHKLVAVVGYAISDDCYSEEGNAYTIQLKRDDTLTFR